MTIDTTELRKLAEAARDAFEDTNSNLDLALLTLRRALSLETVIALLDRLAVAEDALARHEDRCVEEDSEFVYRIQARAVVAEGKLVSALAVIEALNLALNAAEGKITRALEAADPNTGNGAGLDEVRRILTEGAPE